MRGKQIFRLKPIVALLVLGFSSTGFAQGVATERELTPVTVTGTRSALDPNLPASTYSVTSENLGDMNIVNSQDALRYAPDTVVRRLKMSDRSGGIAGRSFGVGQPERVLAYVDGMLISNYLASHQVPKWGIITPDEISRVDVLYGPFSAIYPGNSIGTTIAYSTKVPDKLEASSKVLAYEQRQSNYGFNQNFGGNEESAYIGNRWGDLSASIVFNHTKSQCQGTGYAIPSLSSGAGTVITGAVANRDTTGNSRWLLGTSSMESTDQNLAKIKLAYDFTSTVTGDLLYARWRNDYSTRAQSYIQDASGNTVWGGKVIIDGNTYSIGGTAFAPTEGLEDNEQIGLRVRTRNKTGWNYSVQLSSYEMLTDDKRSSNSAQNVSGGAVAGTQTLGNGTGWKTFELQTTYTPDKDGKHALTFGFHQNQYTLKNQTYNLTNWHLDTSKTTEANNYYGKTQIRALYAQDAWRFLPTWTATYGVRYEQFHAWDGSQYNQAASVSHIYYDERNKSAFSPKLSLSHELNTQWTARASAGRGVRFPTVAELFLGTYNQSNNTLYQNDPNLKPEINDAKEFSLLREVGENSLRLTLFEDDVKDAIYSQLLAGATNTSTVQNVKRVRTRGLEAAFQANNLALNGFDLTASAALLNSKIIENDIVPNSVGKRWVGVPNFRMSLLGSYRTGSWQGSLGIRHEGRRYANLDNSDTNPDTYGGYSAYTVADARLGYTINKTANLAVGINNLTNKQYYDYHPYAGRTAFLELNLKY